MPQRHSVTTLDALPPGSGKAFPVGDQTIALFNVAGKIFAIGDVCPHAGASLAEGQVKGACVTCPWHFADFDLATGKALSGPADDVPSYPVFVTGNAIEVEV
jgi:nitrite reductase (NADH) small subunit